MKIAICISGYFTNKVNSDLMKTNYIYDNIINNINNYDLYIHSFDIKSKELILKKYPQVKKYIIEPQINFREKLNKFNLEFENTLDNKIFPYPITLESQLSFMYSRKKSIMLAIEEDNYDIILWCRFDNNIRCKFNKDQINPTKLIFPEVNSINKNLLYMANWNHFHSGYSDHWFFSNPEIMLKIANMYDSLYNYYNINNPYYNYCKILEKKYKNDGFKANSHTIHKYYLDNCNINNINNIKILTFFGN